MVATAQVSNWPLTAAPTTAWPTLIGGASLAFAAGGSAVHAANVSSRATATSFIGDPS